MMLRASVKLGAEEALLYKAHVVGERQCQRELVTLGKVAVWVDVDDLALAMFATWAPPRRLAAAVSILERAAARYPKRGMR